MDALTEAIMRLLRRVDQVERRLARIEEQLSVATPEAAPATPEPVPSPSPASVVEPVPPMAAAELAPAPAETHQLETRLGLTWINRVGVVTTVLAVAFFFKYAVDNRWIGETGRVALGVIAGVLALTIAERVLRAGHRTYSQGICGGGIAVLYLSFYASFGFYHLVSQPAAFLLMTLVTALAGALALWHDAPAILALGLLGGYATPLLLSTGEDRPWFFFGFVFLLNLGAMAAAKVRHWPLIEAFAFSATAFLYLVWFDNHFDPGEETPATFWALAYFGLFTLGRLPGLAVAGQTLAVVAMLAVWSHQVTYLPLALAICAAGLAVADLRERVSAAVVGMVTFWLCGFIWYENVASPRPAITILLWLTMAFLLLLAWLPWRVLWRRGAVSAQELAAQALNAVAYFSLAYDVLRAGYAAYAGLFAVAVAGAQVALGYALWSRQQPEKRDPRPALLCAGLAVAFLTLAAPIQFTGFRITMAWAVEGAALAWIGARMRSRGASTAALLVFVLAGGRLCFLDAWIFPDPAAYAAIFNIRFLTFLVAALALWLASQWLDKDWSRLATFVAGHAALVTVLILEVLGWADRTVAAENIESVKSATVSILLASYALLLVALGVVAGSGASRVLGLVLVGIVVLKLYLYDVWQLRRLYRVVAFTVLGLLLLLTSFLYSRYRRTIEGWWKKEKTETGA